MKRRTFGLLAGTSALAMATTANRALAQDATDPTTLLKTTLTPFGAERAGNAAGTIPPWTGGFTTIPSDWDPTKTHPPDFFADENPSYVVNSSNMSQYTDQLSDGTAHLIQTLGYSLKVYPTHRTASYPQYVLDNTVLNATRAKSIDDPRLGFSGGYGGFAFPIPDASDPLTGGAQVMWNHKTRWDGVGYTYVDAGWAVSSGQVVLAANQTERYSWPYYDPKGSPETFDGTLYMTFTHQFAPATGDGLDILGQYGINLETHPNEIWVLEQGQGRVRKAPELQFDNPMAETNGVSNYDEVYGFFGSMIKYDWKLLGKKEMLIPYNNNKMLHSAQEAAHGPKFLDPDVIRWELHRVWAVEAALHPGERNTLARRIFYFDEDTWKVSLMDGWDAGGNLFHVLQNFNGVFPNLPGVIYLNTVVYNIQMGSYATVGGPWGDGPNATPFVFGIQPRSYFDPQEVAASASF